MGVHLGSGEVARLAQRGAFRPIVAGTAFEHLYPHDLRHYVAGVLDDSGLREGEIADVPRMNASARRKRDDTQRGVVGEGTRLALVQWPQTTSASRELTVGGST